MCILCTEWTVRNLTQSELWKAATECILSGEDAKHVQDTLDKLLEQYYNTDETETKEDT